MDPESVVAIFNHWKITTGHARARMDIKRAQVIRDRLRDGYEPEDLMLAIDGNMASAWHQGENDRGQAYNDIGLILRDAAHVDRFLAMGEQAHRMIAQRQQREEKAAAQQEQERRAPTEEEKQRVRELLRSCKIRRVA